ncbi:conserved hypothetical protein [Pseudomonas sp. OF001]|jgi:hypothetical protein|uniref:hypothetical protein n=2 Tax=Pseudomonas TaxID=286 RepID=UPI0019AB2110|nr:hypothetical protein [Pseudomonas sp. AN-1]WPP43890.1 hypothetical protein SK095_11350 [Pseudomonas sp. AN-1]CAD5378002.1 conserved hypothetical protein [Pseudomonas sp. OF001]
MNCKTSGTPDGQPECCGHCDSEQREAPDGRMLQMELEWRAQERIAIAELVDQAHHLIQEIIRGEHGIDVLPAASSQLAKASQLLNWPMPFDPARHARNA